VKIQLFRSKYILRVRIVSYSLGFSQAISIVVYIAVKVEEGYHEFVPARKLSEDLEIPGPTAVKILQALNRAGITETREGAKGGVRLAQSPENMTLLDVFHSIERDRSLFRFNIPSTMVEESALAIGRTIINALQQSENAMKESLHDVRISDLYRNHK
jgi:Rrf2 family protein